MPHVERLLIVANPASGRGRTARDLWRLTRGLAAARFSWDLAVSRDREDLRAICRSARAGYNALIAVGGDGTVSEAIQQAAPEGPPLAVWPTGTANLLARELGMRRDVERLVRALRRGRTAPLDLGLCLWPGGERPPRRFATCVGAGLDARVVARVAGRRRGAIRWTAYAGPLLAALAERGGCVTVSVDGFGIGAGSCVVVSNIRRYAGVLRIAPRARYDDGRLDVCLFARGGLVAQARYTALAALGRHGALPDVTCLSGRRVEIASEDSVPVQLDGEPMGGLPVRVEVLPAAARFIVEEDAL